MKKALLFSILTSVLLSCNMNPSKEQRIQKLETELQKSQEKISKLEQQIKTGPSTSDNFMKLGAFSISLDVKDLKASKAFYEKLGFKKLGGDLNMNYLIMKNDNALIGLFQNMFKGNILTFNPGWDENGKNTKQFLDIRNIQLELKNKGLDVGTLISNQTKGPAHFMMKDPDGNVILMDQHR